METHMFYSFEIPQTNGTWADWKWDGVIRSESRRIREDYLVETFRPIPVKFAYVELPKTNEK